MFVCPDSKRAGAYLANIPLAWDTPNILSQYFGSRHYRFPKLAAIKFVNKFVRHYYGEARGDYILSIPQFVKRMKFGCQVNVLETTGVARGRRYPKIAITWSEYHGSRKKRKQMMMVYNESNRIEKLHQASLKAAQKRAEVTLSLLDSSALNFEYDLSCCQ